MNISKTRISFKDNYLKVKCENGKTANINPNNIHNIKNSTIILKTGEQINAQGVSENKLFDAYTQLLENQSKNSVLDLTM